MKPWIKPKNGLPKDSNSVLIRIGEFVAIGQYYSVTDLWYYNCNYLKSEDIDEWCEIPPYR